jgi:hypothetical protein
MTLSKNVISADRRLETTAESTRLELAKHRWRWTLDETNPKRVSITEYAKETGRNRATVGQMVNGYAAWRDAGAGTDQFGDYLERAKLSGDKLAATEAVAQATGTSVGTARRHKASDIREVQATATERALRRGTTPAEEMPAVAAERQRASDAARKVEADRKAAHTLRYVEIEGKLATAKRYLADTLRVAEDVAFADDERELVTTALGELRAIINLVDMRIAGNADVDWDAELAKITGGGS